MLQTKEQNKIIEKKPNKRKTQAKMRVRFKSMANSEPWTHIIKNEKELRTCERKSERKEWERWVNRKNTIKE